MMRFEFSGTLAEFKGFLSTIEAALTAGATVEFTALVSADQQALLGNARLRLEALDACHPYLDPAQKILAIKAVRTVTGWCLADAKAFVEREFPKHFGAF